MDHVEVRRRTYHDSVRLMQASAAVQKVAGVEVALIAMATDLNLGLLEDLHFEVPADTVPDDMVVAIRVAADTAVPAALAALEGALVVVPGSGGGMLAPPTPHLLSSAARLSDLNLGLISVPGPHAYVEAADALRAGLNVMIFSDNVPVEHEIALKRLGLERDLIVMGPDCGTAIVGGLARSGSSAPPAPAPSTSPACSTTPGLVSAMPSGPGAATSRPRSEPWRPCRASRRSTPIRPPG